MSVRLLTIETSCRRKPETGKTMVYRMLVVTGMTGMLQEYLWALKLRQVLNIV